MKHWMKHIIIAVLLASAPAAFATETLFDDFDDGANPTGGGGTINAYPDITVAEIAYDNTIQHLPSNGYSLKLTWDSVDSAGEYAVGVIESLNEDLSPYDAYSFWIYTPNAGTNIKIEIQDGTAEAAAVRLTDYLSTGNSVWQNVIIPLAAFRRANPLLDMSSIAQLKWAATFADGNDASGAVYIDDVSFLLTSHAPAGSKTFSGGDKGTAGDADMPGDTLLWWDLAGSTVTSNEVSVTVQPGYAAAWGTLGPAEQVILEPGTTRYFSGNIINNGNGADAIAFSTVISGALDWPVTIFWDKDGSGTFTAGDIECQNTTGLSPGSTHFFLLRVCVPADSGSSLSSTVRLAAKTGNGSGTNDSWPGVADDDSISTDFTVRFPDVTPPVIAVLAAPAARVGMTGNRMLFAVRVSDGESIVSTVTFHYRINNDPAAAVLFVSTSASTSCSTDLLGAIPGDCTISYSWTATNSSGYSSATSTSTVTVARTTAAEDFSSGTLAVDDGNPDDGQTSIRIPEGALPGPAAVSITQEDRTAAPPGTGSAASVQPAAVYEFGPSGTLFAKPATITLLYPDLDGDGSEDTSGRDERLLRVFWWDGIEWRLLGGRVDTAAKTVSVEVMHLSRYALFPVRAPSPEDFRPKERVITPCSSPGKNDFAQFGVSGDFTVAIFDIAGRKVRTLADGNAIWKGEDDGGNTVESGTYIYQIKTDGKIISGTIVVIK